MLPGMEEGALLPYSCAPRGYRRISCSSETQRALRQHGARARRVPPLTAYNAFFLYALAFVFTGAGAGGALLYRPPFDCEPSSLVEYAFDRRGRPASLAAGAAAGLGMALQFMGSLGGGCAYT